MAKKKRKTTRKRKKAQRRKQSPPLPGWIWMLFGLTVGLAVAAAIYVNDRSPQRPEDAALVAPSAPPARPPPADNAETEPKPVKESFQFYELLPSFEVVIPEEDLEARPDVQAEAVTSPGAYVLQAGSFSAHADADRMKAKLALLGIVSRIQKVSIDDKAFHRVRIGPVKDLTRLNELRGQLRDAKVEIMVIRIAE